MAADYARSVSDRPEDRSHRELRRRFRWLSAPDVGAIAGHYAGSFPRPLAYELACRCVMAATGLSGWQGKRFEPPTAGATAGRVMNLARRDEVKPMVSRIARSLNDGEPALACTYDAREAPPDRWIVDEFRAWDERTLLGLAHLNVPGLRRIGFPFVLRRSASD